MQFFCRALLWCAIASPIPGLAQTAPATTQAAATLTQADALMQQHRFGDAADAYRSLLHHQKPTAALYDRLAAALHQQNLGEPAHWPDEQTEWEHALILDPKNLDALRGIFTLQKLKLQFFSDAKSVAGLRDAAEELIAIDPSDTSAHQWIDASYLIDWLEQSDGPDQDMNVHRQALVAEQQKDGYQPLFAYYIARTLVRQADSLRKHHAPTEEKKHLADAMAVMQKAIDADPQNSASYLLFYRTLLLADAVAKSDDKTDSTYSSQIPAVLSKARQVARPDDPAASEVATSSAAYLMDRHQSAEAERILRQRLALVNNDQSARLLLAKVLDQDASKRLEMIQLMRQPVTDLGGPQVLSLKMPSALQRETQVELLNLLISQWVAAPPGPQRTQISGDIDSRLAELQRASPQSISYLQLHAKLLLLRGGLEGATEAVPELEQARRIYQQHSGEVRARDWDLEYLLATAYTLTNQTGLAKTLLWEIVDARPEAPQVHKSLLRLLIVDRERDLAEEQLAQLKRLTPADSDLPQFTAAIALLHPGAGLRPDVQAVLKALPESTPQQIHAKIADERAAGRTDEVIRLYELLRKQNPAEVSVVNALLTLYSAGGQSDQAQKVMQEALATDPKNLSLQISDAQLHQDAAKIDQLTRQAMDAIADPFDRDMAWYAFYSRRRETSQAMQRLDDAEKRRPQDSKVLNERLNLSISQKQWDIAEKYVDRLGKIDADETGGLFDRVRLDMARGDMDTALKNSQELVQRYPDFAGCWIRLGSVYQAQGDYPKAIDNYNQGLKRQNESLEALKGLVACSTALHKPQDARRYIDQALQIDPANAYFRQESASWEKTNCTPQEIILRRKAERDANPQSLQAWQNLFTAYYQVAVANHAGATTQPDAGQCQAIAEQIRKQWPDERIGYLALADTAKLHSDLVAGEKAMVELAERPAWKKSAVPWLMLAQYYESFHRPDLQEYAIHHALQRDSQSAEAQNAAADFFIRQQRYGEALALLNADSPSAAIRHKVVMCLLEMNRNEDARKACETWLQIHPEDDTTWTNESFALRRLHAYPDALTAASKALQINPNNSGALFDRGASYVEMGPPSAELAVADLQRVCFPLGPSPDINAGHLAELALAHLAEGNPKEATDALQLALTINPTDLARRFELIDIYRHLPTPNLQAAEQLIRQAPHLDPKDKRLALWTGYCVQFYLAEGKTEPAISCARAALEISANEMHDKLMPFLLMAMLHDHQDQRIMDETDILQGTASGPLQSTWASAARAVVEAQSSKTDAAEKDLEAMLDNAPADSSNTFRMADVVMLLNRELPFDQAVVLLRRAARDQPKYLEYVMALYASHGDFAHAAAIADKIADAASAGGSDESWPSKAERAEICALAGQMDKAKGLGQSLQLPDSANAESRCSVALFWSDAVNPPDLARAQHLTDQAAAALEPFDGSTARVWDLQGWLLVQAGQIDAGLKYLTASAALRANPSVHYHLGCTYQLQGHHDQAVKEWQLAQKLLDQLPVSSDVQYFRLFDSNQLITPSLHHMMQSAK